MLVLPPALEALRPYRQFIVCQFVPSAKFPGKFEKFPIDYRTGRIANAHDPSIWTDFDTAARYADAFGPDFSVGFVFTAVDDFWFIDVDNCLQNGQWSPLALELLSRFQGAAVEISHSQTGLHLFGRGTPPLTPRKIKYLDKFDLYTENRFVALTGISALGDAGTDHTPALAALVAAYLTPDPTTPTDWTTQACDGWNGPEDDAQLIDRALRSTSGASAFGSKASFRDLWEANVATLSRVFPDDHGLGHYDESKADSALAQHLSFWTGKNCERIAHLMQLSALVRDKWQREDYIRRTILNVVARQVHFLQDRPVERANTVTPSNGAPQSRTVTGETFLIAQEQIKLFQGCVYVCNLHKVLVPGGYLLKPEQFKVMFGGYSFPMDPMNERISRNAWEAFTESQCFRSPRADGICFRPEQPAAEIIVEGGTTLANIWWPINTPSEKGDITPFLRHVAKLLPDERDREMLLSYMAAVVQHPGVKFQWAPLLQGVKGNGKTLLITCLTRAVGERYAHLPNAQDLGAGGTKFTAWLNAKLLIGIEEIYAADRREMLDALKPLITNSRVEIQGKGQDQITGDNRANFFACSNHKDAVPKDNEERRWAIFFTAQQCVADLTRDGMHGRYFPDLYDWLEGRGQYAGKPPGYAYVTHYLQTYPLTDELNPAKDLHRAPDTSSTREAIELSLGTIEQEILEAVDQGLPGFAGGWISSLAVDRLLARLKADRRIPPRKRRELLTNLGYDWHPMLDNGRVNNPVQPDGGKPRLFVKKDHINRQIPTARMVAEKYTQAQQLAQVSNANFGT